jgi:hypothetical protein
MKTVTLGPCRGGLVPAALACVLLLAQGCAQGPVTSPEAFFGHELGADYRLPSYRDMTAYWERLAAASDRMTLVSMGQTTEGRDQLMAIITSPANHGDLERFRTLSRRLALAEGVSEAEAVRLSREGKAVVWIDGGLHGSEVLGPQLLMETVYRLVSGQDEETLRILDDVIVLAVHANPDGHDLLSDWYMRHEEPTLRSIQDLPRLYQKYVGHDNNREFFTVTQRETRNMARVLFHEWIPQIVYNHHQTGPSGQVTWIPPFREPYNYNVHPLVRLGVEQVGSAMYGRFVVEGKGGVGTREGAGYSTWFNGGLRTITYFHNQLGLLSETKGNPSPNLEEGRSDLPLIPAYQLPRAEMPLPADPGPITFRMGIDYMVSANYAVMDFAARNREHLLHNIWRMGRDAIDKGSRDSWTPSPSRVERVRQAMEEDDLGRANLPPGSCARVRTGMPYELQRPCVDAQGAEPYMALLRDPAERDPYGYILPSDQSDFPTATKFVVALQRTGVAVHRATAPFTVGEKEYPADSWVIRTAQAFRPHILDMFEPQDHPDDFEYQGGPPIHPYDAAGWTLAFQMGVEFHRILEPFEGPFEKVEGEAAPPPGRVVESAGLVEGVGGTSGSGGGSGQASAVGSGEGSGQASAVGSGEASGQASVVGSGEASGQVSVVGSGEGYLLMPWANDAFRAVSRLLEGGHRVARLTREWADGEARYPAGTFFIFGRGDVDDVMRGLAEELGLDFHTASTVPDGAVVGLRQPRVALVDRYGGSRRSGWSRWVLEQFEIPFDVVFVQELDRGDLNARYDAVILVDGILTGTVEGQGDWGTSPFYSASPGPDSTSIPAEFHHMLGSVTVEGTVPRLREFLEAGGTVVTIGSSTILARHLGLPVRSQLVERGPDGGMRSLPGERYFIPASVLEARVDPSHPAAYGMKDRADVMFHRSPVLAFEAGAEARGLRRIAWYDSPEPLRSGWAWGQHHLEGGLAAVEAPVGAGTLYLFAPQILFRSQPHGTYKFLFNALYPAR